MNDLLLIGHPFQPLRSFVVDKQPRHNSKPFIYLEIDKGGYLSLNSIRNDTHFYPLDRPHSGR